MALLCRHSSCQNLSVTETPSRPASRERSAGPSAVPTAAQDGGADLARMALSVHEKATVPNTVERVLTFALAAVDCSHAAVVFVRPGRRLEVVASTDPAVDDLITTQMHSGTGPVLAMVKKGLDSVLVPDSREEDRWPEWASTTVAVGVRSMIGVRLGTSDRTIGTLNLYDSRPHHFSVADVEVAHVLARHAAIALDRAADSENFARALDSRKLIGQAQGILMERFDLDDARAFEVLRRYSQDNNIKLRDVAQIVVDTRRLPDPPSVRP
jgi:GAF domain-containing protein